MELDTMLEHELVERAQKEKDAEAFGKLYDAYYSPIYRFLLYRCRDEDLAKDLTSETFFQALKNLWRFRWQGKPFLAWLYRIAYYQLLVYQRNNRRYCPLTNEESPELLVHETAQQDLMEQEDQRERQERCHKVRQVLRRLPDREHTILILRYFVQKSIREVADILRIPQGTVKSHIHRALKKLELFLSEEGRDTPKASITKDTLVSAVPSSMLYEKH